MKTGWQCLRLAFLRFRRSRGNALCRVLALSAMMLPLVVLLGLKFGILSSMKENLRQNPEALEIWFPDLVPNSPADAERYRSWPEVGFVLPCAHAAYASVGVLNPAAENAQEISVDTTPTAPGDPLLQYAALPVPGAGEVVLSAPLAKELAVSSGGTLRLCARRNARREQWEREVRVVGVLPRRFCQRSMMYAPAEFCLELEEFMVQGKGEPYAAAEVAGAVYDGLLLRGTARAQLAELLRGVLPALSAELTSRQDATVPEGALLLHGGAVRFSPQQLQTLLSYRTAHAEAPVLWVRPVKATLAVGTLPPQEVLISCAESALGSPSVCQAPPQLLVHPGDLPADCAELRLLLESPQGLSEFCCVVKKTETVPPGKPQAAPQLLALLHSARRQLLVWNYQEGGLRHPVVEFVAMRMYASSLDSVTPLMEKLRAEGRNCRARLDAVQNVLALERNLDMLFLLLCLGVGVGAVLSFGMSLFNAVELCRRDFALVQLLGAGRFAVVLIPVAEALLTTCFSLVVVFICFEIMRCAICYAFADMADAQSICLLLPQHRVFFALISLSVACLASWAAALRVLRISPSEILRDS